jgi:D-amino peptidase
VKVYIMTDLECVAGIVTFPEYCLRSPVKKCDRPEGGMYYDISRDLITQEVNAAVEGLIEAGATDIFVCDGHGQSSVDISMIHPETRVLAGNRLTYPLGMD